MREIVSSISVQNNLVSQNSAFLIHILYFNVKSGPNVQLCSPFSDGKEALANPDCDAMNLLEFIAFKCGWTKSDNEIGKTFQIS